MTPEDLGYISPREYLKKRLNLRWQHRIDPGPANYPQVAHDYQRGIDSIRRFAN